MSNITSSPVQETAPRPPSPTVAPLTPPADDDDPRQQARSSPSFDYHQERRLHLKDEIWLSHHLPRLPPTTSEETGAAGGAQHGGPSTSPKRARTTPGEIMMGQKQARVTDASPSAFHPTDLPNLQRGGRSMSMDEDDDEDEAEDREGVRAALRKERSKSNLLSPPFALGPDGQPAMINRQELDDQERLDLEEEKRERELNGQGFPGFGTQHAGQGNSTAAPQPEPTTDGNVRAIAAEGAF